MLVIVETLVVGTVGGFLMNQINFPLPWMLGPLIGVVLWNKVLKRRVYMPFSYRQAGLVIIGYVSGSSFTREAASQIAKFLPAILIITLATIFFSFLLAYIIRKPMRVTLSSALLGNVPGGLAQMVALCDDLKGTDITYVTFMQSIRLVSVIFFVPFFVVHGLAENSVTIAKSVSHVTMSSYLTYPWLKLILLIGAAAAGVRITSMLRFPSPQMIGPIVTIALLTLLGIGTPAMPKPLIIPAQITVGIYMGMSFRTSSIPGFRKAFVLAILSTAAMIGFSFINGYYLAVHYGMDLTTAFLSTAPGGVSEMAITAIAVNANIPFVAAFQVFRILFILFTVPPFLLYMLPRQSKEKESKPDQKNITAPDNEKEKAPTC